MVGTTELAQNRRLTRQGFGFSPEAVHVRRQRERSYRLEVSRRGDTLPGWITMGLGTPADVQKYLNDLPPEAREKAQSLINR